MMGNLNVKVVPVGTEITLPGCYPVTVEEDLAVRRGEIVYMSQPHLEQMLEDRYVVDIVGASQ